MQTSVGIDPAVARAAQDFWQQLDSPIALSCAILARYGEWIQIAEKRVDPGHYVALLPRLPLPGASRLARDYQSVELLRKFPGLPIGVDRAQKALDSFFKNEATCRRTNERLRHLSYCIETGFVPDPADEYLHTFVERARKFIRRVLGPLPRFLVPRFGPGSTFESKASPASHNLTLGDKMECGFVCTGPCVPLLPFAYESAWGRWVAQRTSQSSHTLVRGNRFTTVPKDALKDRGICIEAGVNVAFQCYLGSLMKGRLWDAGCDLYAGQAYHGRVAREASMSGSSATID